MATIEKFIEPPLMLHIIEMREYAYIPWICRNNSPCIFNRAFKYLATFCDKLFNVKGVKPNALCLDAQYSTRSESFCHKLKEWGFEKLMIRPWIVSHTYDFFKTLNLKGENKFPERKRKRERYTYWVECIHYYCIIVSSRIRLQKCNSCIKEEKEKKKRQTVTHKGTSKEGNIAKLTATKLD